MADRKTMKAMILAAPGAPLQAVELPIPRPAADQILIEVGACGVCRTDLHIADGELQAPRLPLILGHEIVGRVAGVGSGVRGLVAGDRIGVPWLGLADGTCRHCLRDQENLCDRPLFTGYSIDGGYAEYAVADHRFCYRLPPQGADTEIAPLLCAGLIGYRSYRMIGDNVERLGFYGFGAAAHLLVQLARYEGKQVYAFTRSGDSGGQNYARKLGAVWAGGSEEASPDPLDAAIVFAPVGSLVPAALRATAKGGTVVCAGIHMSDIPSFPYGILWQERSIRSVANLKRSDGREFFDLVVKANIRAEVSVLPLEQANDALRRVREGTVAGAAVLEMSGCQKAP